MNILADSALPNAVEIFSRFGEVRLKPGREIIADDLTDIEVLIVRSVTKINAELLSHADKLRFVGTATAGFDHVDTGLLQSRGIGFSAAPGNNKASVGDYILSVLLVLAQRRGLKLPELSIGVVGCGNTGSEVIKKCTALGMKVLKCDPPRFKAGDASCNATLREALDCDITTLHVPLTKGEDEDATYHMLNYALLKSLKPGKILINASRGPVVDNPALYEVLRHRPDLQVWLDVFEGEPEITCRGLLPLVAGATPHIAGYSYES